MGYNSRCAVCRDRSKRDLVAARLEAGDRPADVLRAYPDLTSAASLYLHCRSHLDASRMPLQWVDGESTTGDLITDTARQARQLAEARDRAFERGDDRNFATLSHEHNTTTGLLERLKVFQQDGDFDMHEVYPYLTGGMHRATEKRPDFARELAAGIIAWRDDREGHSLADELEHYAATAETEKEK